MVNGKWWMVNGVVNSRESLVEDQSSNTKDLSARDDISLNG